MKVITIEVFNGEFSLAIPVEGGFKPFFTESKEEAEQKAFEVFGNEITVNFEELED